MADKFRKRILEENQDLHPDKLAQLEDLLEWLEERRFYNHHTSHGRDTKGLTTLKQYFFKNDNYIFDLTTRTKEHQRAQFSLAIQAHIPGNNATLLHQASPALCDTEVLRKIWKYLPKFNK